MGTDEKELTGDTIPAGPPQFRNEVEQLAWTRAVAAELSTFHQGFPTDSQLEHCFTDADHVVEAMRQRSAKLEADDEAADAEWKAGRARHEQRQDDIGRKLDEYIGILNDFMRATGYTPPQTQATSKAGGS